MKNGYYSASYGLGTAPTRKKLENRTMKIKEENTNESKLVDYSTLIEGDSFVLCACLHTKLADDEFHTQRSINHTNNTTSWGLCGCMVLPVDVELVWSRK